MRLGNCVVRDEGDVEVIFFAEFETMLPRCPASAPGPDGLKFVRSAKAGDAVAQILYRAYSAIIAGRPVPPKSNDGIAVVFPNQPQETTHLAAHSPVAAFDARQHIEQYSQ